MSWQWRSKSDIPILNVFYLLVTQSVLMSLTKRIDAVIKTPINKDRLQIVLANIDHLQSDQQKSKKAILFLEMFACPARSSYLKLKAQNISSVLSAVIGSKKYRKYS